MEYRRVPKSAFAAGISKLAGLLLIFFLIFEGRSRGAVDVDERNNLPPCAENGSPPAAPGRVVRLFELRKDRNPENVLVMFTYADSSCRFIGDIHKKDQLIDMYWRINADSPEQCYKPTHPKIKSETLKTLKATALSPDKTKIKIDMTQLDQLQHDLRSREVEVELSPASSGCQAKTSLQLGPSGKNKIIYISELIAKGKYVMNIPKRSIKQLEVKGSDGKKNSIRAVFLAK